MHDARVPRLAAVVVNYRTPEATAAAVHSLMTSTRVCDDVIVVENGSADGSDEYLHAALPAATVIAAVENGGFAAGANIGIREALGRGADLVLLVNSDAVLDAAAVALLERDLLARPGAGIAAPLLVRPGSPPTVESLGIRLSSVTGRMRLIGSGTHFDRQALSGTREASAVSGCVMLVKRAVFDRIGLLVEDYFWGFEDIDFCLAARQSGFDILVVADAIVCHAGSLSIGRQSPRRLFWAARNHLLVLERRAPLSRTGTVVRGCLVVAYNLVHALTRAGVPRAAGVKAVVAGVRAFLSARRRRSA
jgi:GT2 family glycosyltransferase